MEEVLEPVDRSLCNFYSNLHAKSAVKHRKLKNLFTPLAGQFEMYSAGVHPMKPTGTCWIDHKTHAMDCVVEKSGLYTQHMQNVK